MVEQEDPTIQDDPLAEIDPLIHAPARLRVMTYRENRGGEVSTPAFTDQFDGVALAADGVLDANIDGISGATLSVQALTRMASLALYLHNDSGCKDGA